MKILQYKSHILVDILDHVEMTSFLYIYSSEAVKMSNWFPKLCESSRIKREISKQIVAEGIQERQKLTDIHEKKKTELEKQHEDVRTQFEEDKQKVSYSNSGIFNKKTTLNSITKICSIWYCLEWLYQMYKFTKFSCIYIYLAITWPDIFSAQFSNEKVASLKMRQWLI